MYIKLETTIENILSHTQQDKNTGCMLWKGSKTKKGYGQFTEDRSRVYVHRKVLELKLGRELTCDEVARHTCDTPSCCNPAHIVVGTHEDNMSDMRKRQRGAYRNLTDEERAEIEKLCRLNQSPAVIARQFGVSRSYISHIRKKLSHPEISAV